MYLVACRMTASSVPGVQLPVHRNRQDLTTTFCHPLQLDVTAALGLHNEAESFEDGDNLRT